MPFVSKAHRYGPCLTRESHSFTCHPHRNHKCLYSPALRHQRPLADTHCVYPGRDGLAELTWVVTAIFVTSLAKFTCRWPALEGSLFTGYQRMKE